MTICEYHHGASWTRPRAAMYAWSLLAPLSGVRSVRDRYICISTRKVQRNANKGSAEHPQPRETEVTLIAVGHRAAGVLSQIARLRRVGNYCLAPRPAQRIGDHYLDTPTGALAAKRLALRIRDIAHQQWLTLKGPAHVTAYHAIERLEIETPWSAAALQALVDELASFGLDCVARDRPCVGTVRWKLLRALDWRRFTNTLPIGVYAILACTKRMHTLWSPSWRLIRCCTGQTVRTTATTRWKSRRKVSTARRRCRRSHRP
ncbi:MAG: CYTH domain-containing protein [Nitrospira sp.]|nr:CYTH domain-containing protein [Nitrospira sp.]